jgi:hypothetical protein
MVGDVSAAVGFNHGNGIADYGDLGALSHGIDGKMFYEPKLVRRRILPAARELAHRLPRRLILGATEFLDHDFFDDSHNTITTDG